MRRLFLQIYLAFIGVLVALTLTGSLLWWWSMEDIVHPALKSMAERVASELPPPDAPVERLQSSLEVLAEEFGVFLVVWDAHGSAIASVGRRLPRQRHGFRHPREWTLALDGGRQLGVRLHRGRLHGSPLLGLVLLAGVIGVVAYLVARRITSRLERLRRAVEDRGAGDLDARVTVEGRDEIAMLAGAFNDAAERIQGLVSAQQRLLASASHELRSPLARLRMALELLAREPRPEHLEEAEADIAELDALIEDLLTAARLQSGDAYLAREAVDLRALLVEEAARVGVEATGESVTVIGDARLLRRLMRNLLENARRHGGQGGQDADPRIEAWLEPIGSQAVCIVVADRGPGVPEDDRERIFEPFYRPAGHSEGEDGGVGLGLSLVREIARHHGGDAYCLPREGGGTRFEVELDLG